MPTPKPGQIRCPTCHQPTPPAAFCTQCGTPIPDSARTRPRGMDRDELQERLRGRQPADAPFRRGQDAGGATSYVPFEPEPEDALIRDAEQHGAVPPVAGPSHDAQAADLPPVTRPVWREPERPAEPEPGPEPAWPDEEAAYQEAAGPDAEPVDEDEDFYAYRYVAPDDLDDGRGGGMLPLLGFAALAVMALAVGVILAGVIGGPGSVADATPTPSAATTTEPSVGPSAEETAAPSEPGTTSSPVPTDGPIAFPDGALLTIQPCATREYRQQAVGRPEELACQVDGSSVNSGQVWAIVVFRDTAGSDTLGVRLRSNGETLNEQERVLSSVLTNCGDSCGGLIYMATYSGLAPGEYELVLMRNGEFADSASFEVLG